MAKKKSKNADAVSNRTIVTLLLVAVGVSLLGTLFSLQKLGTLTGFQGANVTTDSGTTTVTVLGTAQLTLRVDTVDFGSGQVNGSLTGGTDYCNLATRVNATTASGNTFAASSPVSSAACISFNTDVSSFELENTGNVAFTNVTLNSSLGATLPAIQGAVNGVYQYLSVEDSAGTCTTVVSSFTNFTANAADSICDNFAFAPSDDAVAIRINLTIPEDAVPGTSTDTITFVGTV